MRIVILVTMIALLFITLVIPTNAEPLPSWTRNLAYWYSQGQITDQEFTAAIQYLEVQPTSPINLNGYSNSTQLILQYSNATVVQPFINGSMSSIPTTTISIITDKPSYMLDSFIEITGSINPPSSGIEMTIIDPNGNIKEQKSISEGSNGIFALSLETNSLSWIPGQYTIKVESGNTIQNQTIDIESNP